jgi:hypothetical protein
MDTKTIIEAVGYLGSALVLVSFLMVSVVKLRIVNSIGSIIFTVYAFIIQSYPTAIMNLCLVIINIYHLVKLANTEREYDFVKVAAGDNLLRYTIETHAQDIEKCFPGTDFTFKDANRGYVVCHKGTPAGIVIGNLDENGSMDLILDYSTPEYRDFSIGKFLFSKLPEEGIKLVTFHGATENHKAYLEKTGFVKKDDHYEKKL